MTFRVGQKVVCVDAGSWRHLKNGTVYTVLATWAIDDGDPGFLTVDSQRGGGQYRRRRFRPIVERKTDISIFTEMLTKTRVDA
jgi:hypothetical protein